MGAPGLGADALEVGVREDWELEKEGVEEVLSAAPRFGGSLAGLVRLSVLDLLST